MRTELNPKLDIKGNRYGRLVAEEFLYFNEKNKDCWRFKCDCGNEKIMPAANVKWGGVRSCGCLAKEHMRKLKQQDITGERFGKLMAVKPTKDHDLAGSIIWECTCDCGNTAFYSVSILKRGAIKSCGCLYKESRKECSSYRKDIVDDTNVSNLISAKKLRKDNTSGHPGIYWNQKNGSWMTYITFQKKRYYLGSYRDKDEAIQTRRRAEKELHDPIIKERWEDLTEKSKKKYLEYLSGTNPEENEFI